jgi:hypothetical protein
MPNLLQYKEDDEAEALSQAELGQIGRYQCGRGIGIGQWRLSGLCFSA